jgi:hypothetical protein
MELDELKKEWQSIKTPQIGPNELKNMTIERSHPVLSDIRKQLIIECMGWSGFLIVCFTGLDAEQKPLLSNVILLLSVGLPMVFNIYGYRLSKGLIAGPNIYSSLQNRMESLNHFAIISVVLRIVLIIGVIYFFIANRNIDQGKMLLIGAGILLLILPLYSLVRIWIKRISQLSGILKSLEAEA